MRLRSVWRTGVQAVVGCFQHVMLALDQVAAHVQPLRGGDVAGLLEVAHDQAGQQAQAERMVAVRLAGLLDLGVRAADALGAEELHRVGGLPSASGPPRGALEQAAALGFQDPRT